MSDKSKIDKSNPDALNGSVSNKPAAIAAGGVSRRSLAKAGVVAPVTMSLLSNPVWGGNVACSVSALMSANISGHDHDGCDFRGCTPGFWKNNLDAWDGLPYSPGECARKKNGRCVEWNTVGATTFFNVFGFEPEISASLGLGVSLLDVMLEHELAGNVGTYENHLVAALLNAAKAPAIFGMTETQVITIAFAVKDGGNYTDGTGGTVTRAQFEVFIKDKNEEGNCYMNSKGDCAPGYVNVEGRCVPSCQPGFHFDSATNTCVPDTP